MRSLTPNGDITKRQRVDPLTTESREGIYEVARGIVLRMAWNNPDAYERALRGDWSFVGWDNTVFSTAYKIGWEANPSPGPLMFADVRILMNNMFIDFFRSRERYENGRRYFSPTCGYFDFFPYEIDSEGDVIDEDKMMWTAPSLIGSRGGIRPPFLAGREKLKNVDCGRSAILKAIDLIGARYEDNGEPDIDLFEVARPNANGYDEVLGESSYYSFLDNVYALYDDWEMGESALLGMFDRCYWAMMSENGYLAHPPVKIVEERRRYDSLCNMTWRIEEYDDGGGAYVICDISPGGVEMNKEETPRVFGEVEVIKLRTSATRGESKVSIDIRHIYPAAPLQIDVGSEGTVVEDVVVNSGASRTICYRRRYAEYDIGSGPRLDRGFAETVRTKSVEIDESFDESNDHISQRTWIAERYDSDYDGGHHRGVLVDAGNDLRLGEAFGRYLERFAQSYPKSIPFAEYTVTHEAGQDQVRFHIDSEFVMDVYDESGEYIGTSSTIGIIRPGDIISVKYDPGSFERSESVSDGVYDDFRLEGGYVSEGEIEFDVKMGVFGRSDIPM